MKTRPRDIAWGGAAALIMFVVFVAAISLVTQRGDPIKLLVGIVPGTFLAVGCWRRTKWGAPEDGLRAWQERRATGELSDD